MGRIFAELDDAISERVSEVTLELHGELVSNPPKGTPVDTGFASVSWGLSVGTTHPYGVASDTASAASQQQAGIAEVASYRIVTGQSLWVFNNTSYIAKLNAGSSKQSPQGFVEQAIDTTLSKFRNKSLN
jgi:murein endopeptidase